MIPLIKADKGYQSRLEECCNPFTKGKNAAAQDAKFATIYNRFLHAYLLPLVDESLKDKSQTGGQAINVRLRVPHFPHSNTAFPHTSTPPPRSVYPNTNRNCLVLRPSQIAPLALFTRFAHLSSLAPLAPLTPPHSLHSLRPPFLTLFTRSAYPSSLAPLAPLTPSHSLHSLSPHSLRSLTAHCPRAVLQRRSDLSEDPSRSPRRSFKRFNGHL